MSGDSTYEKLVSELKRLDRLSSILGLLEWDEQVNLPPKSAGLRGEQMAHFAALLHRETTSSQIGDWLSELEEALPRLTPEQKVVVRETRKDYDRQVKLPPEFVSRRTEARSRGYHGWAQAREESDFKRFAPVLKEQLELAKEEATYLGFTENPYDYWIDQFDPGMTSEIIDRLFEELKPDLLPLVERILASPVKPKLDFLKGFPVEKQETFLTKVVSKLGFDFNRGRIDRSLHPFCGGHGLDTRLTTRFDRDNPLDSLFSSIHETGHGLYEQGLPEEHLGIPLGEAVGMAVHESQSRLWENQVGRSRAFWNYWEPIYRECFGRALSSTSSDELYLAINAVRLNPIRVDSDEVTYNLHILLRFDLEKRLFRGDITVDDLPEAWNEASKKYLGFQPKNDAEGVLQDVHWSSGGFGYFPSYCLGNMLAAQLWLAARQQISNLESSLAKGNFMPLLSWLRDNIHRHGKQYNTWQLTKQVTGAELSPKSLIAYLKERYGPLYLSSDE